MRVYIGTSGFQYAEWKGGFYPEDLSTAKMLAYYAERLGSTESNYTFRHLPSAKSIERWRASTPTDFRFSFKAQQRITHFSKLRDCAEIVSTFYQAIAPMREKLGAVLFQLPPTLKADVDLLRAFLKTLPRGVKAAFEFRHESWFTEPVYAALRKAGAALCLAEDEELTTPPIVTAKFGYLRLRKENYSPAALKRWAEFISQQDGTWSEAYVYFRHEETGSGPKFATALQKRLAK
jgi:uncharacterized protein YecE (DUF72 family)